MSNTLERLNDILEPEDAKDIWQEYDEEVIDFMLDNDIDLDEIDEVNKLLEGGTDEEIILAGIECDVELENIEEAYAGEFRSDEEFAEDLADQLGLIDSDATWPQSYIDWKRAARDLMMDYAESDGYYFRMM